MNARATRLVVPSLLLLLLPAILPAATNRLELVDKSATEWVKIRLETARLSSAWTADRALLESIAESLDQRVSVLQEKRDLLLAKTASERDEMAALQAKVDAAAEDLRLAQSALTQFGTKLLELEAVLPPRLASALEMSFRSLAQPDLPAAERMQVAMTVLSRCAQFNRMVSSGDEVLTIDPADGPRSVEVIYWGLSHAYALDRAARKAWFGSPGSARWEWTAQPEAVEAVKKLIAVYNDKADPIFVAVPAMVRHTAQIEGQRP